MAIRKSPNNYSAAKAGLDVWLPKAVCCCCILLPSVCMPLSSATTKRGTFDPAAISCGGAPIEDCDDKSYLVENPDPGDNVALRVCNSSDDQTHTIALAKTSADAKSRQVVVSANTCHKRGFSPNPAWITSAALSPAGDQIVISDPMRGVLAFYDFAGILLNEVSNVEGSPAFAIKPSLINRTSYGYLLENGEGMMLYLDQNLRVIDTVDLVKSGKGTAGAIGAIYAIDSIRDTFIAVGDVQKPNGRWFTGLLRIRIDAPDKFEVMREIAIDDPMRTFYHIGLPYLTTLNEVGFIIFMEKSPRIYRVSDKLIMMKKLPLTKRGPDLPKPSGASSYPGIYEAIEKTEMPAGLYGWRNFLYLLTRKPGAEPGQTIWTLLKIDPHRETVIGKPMRLPTNAAHLVVIPGPQHWILIEKGQYKGVGQQKLGKTTLLPSSWVEAANLPQSYTCQ